MINIKIKMGKQVFIKIGEYHLIEEIGYGAYGKVYKGYHVRNPN